MGDTIGVVTWGMGVWWSINAATQDLAGRIEVLDLRTLEPLDWDAIAALVARHNKILLVTEEPELNTFAEALAGRISRRCFRQLDAPVEVVGSANVPAIPVNEDLEAAYLAGVAGVRTAAQNLLGW
jgi:2-oxoisovalerate dehydrogenase E1 component